MLGVLAPLLPRAKYAWLPHGGTDGPCQACPGWRRALSMMQLEEAVRSGAPSPVPRWLPDGSGTFWPLP